MNIKKILKKICIGTPGEQVSVCMEMTGGGGAGQSNWGRQADYC